MLDITLAFIVFCAVLFLYLHIQYQLKTSSDLEIFDLDLGVSKEKWEEVCELRQPARFHYTAAASPTIADELGHMAATMRADALLRNYPTFEVKIRDLKDAAGAGRDAELYVPLQLHLAAKLFRDDRNATYLSEANGDFLAETGAVKNMSYNDEFLRPPLVSQCRYDVWMASHGSETPLRYNLNYRNYFMATGAPVRVKLIPPQYTKYLHGTKDYDNFEFRSPISPWNPQPAYQADFFKAKCLEFVLSHGELLYVPAYWWHSFQFSAGEGASVAAFYYRTYMNTLAIAPELFMCALQQQNVQHKRTRTLSLHRGSGGVAAAHGQQQPQPQQQENAFGNGSNDGDLDLNVPLTMTPISQIFGTRAVVPEPGLGASPGTGTMADAAGATSAAESISIADLVSGGDAMEGGGLPVAASDVISDADVAGKYANIAAID